MAKECDVRWLPPTIVLAVAATVDEALRFAWAVQLMRASALRPSIAVRRSDQHSDKPELPAEASLDPIGGLSWMHGGAPSPRAAGSDSRL